MLAFSTSDHVQLCEENGRAYEEPRQRLPISFLSGTLSELTGVWILTHSVFNTEFELVGQ